MQSLLAEVCRGHWEASALGLEMQLALEQGKVKDGTVLAMIAAGTGYTWAANIVKWGPM